MGKYCDILVNRWSENVDEVSEVSDAVLIRKRNLGEEIPIKKTKKAIMKWIFVVVIVGVIIYTFRDSAGPILEELKCTAPSVLIGICLMSIIYELIEGGITCILCKQYHPEFKYRWGVGNAMFCSFYRVATLGSGAGIAAIIFLKEHEMEYSKAFGLYMLQYAFHKISIAIFSAIFFALSWGYMIAHYGTYTWLLTVGFIVTMLITIILILFCCSERFHKVVFAILAFFNRKGKHDAEERELRRQCDDLEEASRYLLKKKGMVAGVIGLNLVKLCFWYAIPYLLFAGSGSISLMETMAITALAVMLAAVIPSPAGIGSTELMFITLFTSSVGTGLAGSASLLYRFATFVLPFLLGALVVVHRRIHQKLAEQNL